MYSWHCSLLQQLCKLVDGSSPWYKIWIYTEKSTITAEFEECDFYVPGKYQFEYIWYVSWCSLTQKSLNFEENSSLFLGSRSSESFDEKRVYPYTIKTRKVLDRGDLPTVPEFLFIINPSLGTASGHSSLEGLAVLNPTLPCKWW